jgi:hypothetical protein
MQIFAQAGVVIALPVGRADTRVREHESAAGHTDDHRLVELERSDGLGQGAPAGGAITEERRDPRDETHAVTVPGLSNRENSDRPAIRCRSSAKPRQLRASRRSEQEEVECLGITSLDKRVQTDC